MPTRTNRNDIAHGRCFDDFAEGYRPNPVDVRAPAALDETERACGIPRPRIHPGIPVVTGPIWGIPGDEVAAWIESWNSDTPLPEPQARWIDIV
jgi:hypothetical protein